MKDILLSVVIPVYNVEAYIEKCIESILSQSFINYEIILVNDGSTDRSGNICDMYANLYKNIYVYHIENKGVSNARNVGIRKAKGKYIHFMDSDDTIDKQMYEEYYNITSNFNYDIVISGYKSIEGTNSTILKPKSKIKVVKKDQIKYFLNSITIEDKP